MTPRLYRVILPVNSIERAAEFYAALLGQAGERVSPGRHYFDCGGTILACYDPAADGDPVGEGWRFHENQYVYFAVADLEAAFARARAAGCVRIDDSIAACPGAKGCSMPTTRLGIRSVSLMRPRYSRERAARTLRKATGRARY